MGSRLLRLRPDTAINVTYQDRTPYGSPHGAGPERAVCHAFAPLLARIEAGEDPHRVLADPAAALRLLADSPTFEAMTEPAPDGWRVRESVRFPKPASNQPRLLTLARPGTEHVVRARLPLSFWADAHDLLHHLANGGLAPDARAALRPELGQLIDLLATEDLLETTSDRGSGASPAAGLPPGDFTFLGHNTVLVRAPRTTALIDPLLFATSDQNPAGYQPYLVRDLPRPDVVALTHGHPDHFDPASLLRIDRHTPLIVPAIERETFLSTDLARRAEELGFTQVRPLAPGERTVVGELTFTAYPFFGEQPTDSTWLHPELRNVGCTYRVDTPTASAVFLADSGFDAAGDVRRLAIDARRAHGPVDVVFSGYRGWLTYPVQLLASSVGRFFLFVPPDLWRARMTMMSTADMALDVAERWGASVLCPYADGGAPWHWRLGLGPALDDPASEVVSFDPFPERVLEAAARRSSAGPGAAFGASVPVAVLRPGQTLRLDLPNGAADATSARSFRVVETDGHRWPYG